MAKKEFKIENAVDKFFTQSAQEEQHTQEEQKKKKLPRINMAFYDDHLEYLQLISRVKGFSITQYVNELIAADKTKNEVLIKQAKELFGKE